VAGDWFDSADARLLRDRAMHEVRLLKGSEP